MNPLPPFAKILALMLILFGAVLVPALGRAALSRIDEGQIAEVSREMVRGGDWVTPRIGGAPFAAYPPLAYWLFAFSGSLLGFTEFAMRLPTALASLALIAVIALRARRLAGAEAGLATAMVLATLPSYFVQSGICRADVITMLFATTAFDRFLAWADDGRKPRDLALMYAFTALGILAKGPLAVAVLGLGGLSWFLLRRQWTLLGAMKFWIGVPSALLIVVPWYYVVYRRNGWAFLHENLFLENLDAFSQGYQQKRPWYFYFTQTPLLLPWLLVLPLSWKVRREPGVALSLVWFGLVVLFFTISSAKRINYLTYFGPPLAMAAGTTLVALGARAPHLLRNAWLGLGAVLAAGAALVALLPTSLWTGSGVSKIAPQLPMIALLAGAGAGAIAALAWSRGPQAASVGAAALAAAGFLVYGVYLNPRLNPENRETADFCRRAATVAAPGETVSVPAPDGAEGVFHFYVGRALPLGSGEPGLYIATQTQEELFLKNHKNVQILDSMLDHRGRYRYLLRIHP